MAPRRATLAILLAAYCATASADDWPQWLGPERNGLSAEGGLLQEWPESGPKRVWLYENAGVGYGGPAIVEGKLYALGQRGGKQQLIVLDVGTGDELWSRDLDDSYTNDWGDGPRGTPTVVGNRVYCLGAKGALVCFNAASGDEVWRVRMQDFGGEIPVWGYSESPLVHDGRVVVTPGGPKGAIVALDDSTGELLWQSGEVTDGAHYSSVVAATIHGKTQYVQLLVEHLVGVEPASGKVLWKTDWPGRVAVIPTPIVHGNQVYATSGYGVGCLLVEIAHDNTTKVIYENKTMKNHHGGVLLLGDKLYGHSDGVGWLCQDFATGEQVWRERGALGKGAIAYADGRFYCQSEDEGTLTLIEASPEGWKEHGRFTLDPQTKVRKDRGKVWTHPVISGGRMYVRDQDLLFSFDVSEE